MTNAAGKGGKIELLAPGGSMEGIRAAVNAGADAVYAGGRLFGARAFAQNPETGDLLEAIDYCHLNGVKLYLTVNTLLKEHELTQILPEYLAPIYEHGVDAVLVQDFGVFHFLRQEFPDLPLHASTQMTVTGADGAALLQEMGAKRVVLSRELSLEEILSIRRHCDVELETFVHGALCYCYSGKCLMSSMIGGRSGNRGRCAQPCRLPWDLIETPKSRRLLNEKTGKYLLSPKDICTLRLIPDLVDAGIASLKIEGRMKSPEYAAGVTAMYRRYIDLYLERGRGLFRVEESDEKLLSELFSRGEFSEGYYHTRNGRDMMTLKEKREMSGESLRRTQETAGLIRERYVDAAKKVPLRAEVRVRRDERIVLRVTDRKGHSFCAEGSVPSPAVNRPADRDAVLKQIGKTGNTDFEFESVGIELDDGLFVQVRDLNTLRRDALDGIRGEILRPFRRGKRAPVAAPGQDARGVCPDTRISHPPVTASVCTDAQLEAVLQEERIGGVYLDYSICTSRNAGRVRGSGRKAYLMLPGIWREDTARIIRRMMEREFGSFSRKMKDSLDGVLVRSHDQLHFLLNKDDPVGAGDGFEVIADAELYTWNSYACRMLSDLGVTMDTLPYECSSRELRERGCGESECVVYGYQTLMLSAQCLVKTTTGCTHEPGIRYLKDRRGVLFPVKNDCLICTGMIFNSVPLDLVSLSGRTEALSPASIRYMFTVESGEETRRILGGQLPDAVTRGHFRKGAQ